MSLHLPFLEHPIFEIFGSRWHIFKPWIYIWKILLLKQAKYFRDEWVFSVEELDFYDHKNNPQF